MKTRVHAGIALSLVLVLVFLARGQADGSAPWNREQGTSAARAGSAANPDKDKGTVRPPPADVVITGDGTYSIGGVSTLTVSDLAPGYAIAAFLANHAFALGRIPDGAGSILADITFIRYFHQGRLIPELPPDDGDVTICYAVPPGVAAQIYFFDFYGPRFGERRGQPSWEPLETTVENGIACASARRTGAYALIGQ